MSRVLIVEDEDLIREMLVLFEGGYAIATAADGKPPLCSSRVLNRT